MSIRGFTHVALNRPTVNTPEAVNEVLRQFNTRPELKIVADDKSGSTMLAFDEDSDIEVEWPSAVHADAVPADVHQDEWEESVVELHEARGQEGLADLLLALAPHLKTPLVLQAAAFSSDGEFHQATQWTVPPGATQIEIKDVVALGDDGSQQLLGMS